MTLSKSDFQLASDCPMKLVYKKKGYPTTNDTNEYMEMLAQGGYIIGHMATLGYPGGVEVGGTTREALQETERLMGQREVAIFEAAVQAGEKLIRADILVKKGATLHLIEVKAKSHDTEDEVYKQIKQLDKYINDVAYQYLVLSEAYPGHQIQCSLLMPDKAKRTTIEGLAGWFRIEQDARPTDRELEEIITQARPRFRKPKVVFKYENDPQREDRLAELRASGILSLRDVTAEVIAKVDAIEADAETFLRIVNEGIEDDDYAIGKHCKGCEFNTPEEKLNGYKECWGALADVRPHVFDLYYGGAIRSRAGFYLDDLIRQRQASLRDIDPERLKNAKGQLSTRGARQWLQIQNTLNPEEWISPDLQTEAADWAYPLHFIDFETYTGAVPFHAGNRPYELIAFQWSCHTILKRGAEPNHREWIHRGVDFPNFDFATSLMEAIGNTGTPLMWATHENTVLRKILGQMEDYGKTDKRLERWLTTMTHDKDMDREGRLVDMNMFTQRHYFHPAMKGRTSIKVVLPAIWNNFPYLHEVPFFKSYSAKDLDGFVIDPYDTLAASAPEGEGDDVVAEGTAAMRAYYRIRFDESLDEGRKEELIRQLLAYCKLDTMAMVIIAHHWVIK